MPLKPGATIGEARETIQEFLSSAGCYDICARCPVYPNGVGCCHGCAKLARSEAGEVLGCSQPNLSCLSYTCSVLDRHLLEIGRFEEFNALVYGIPREGYRGCEPRPSEELLQFRDPIREIRAVIVKESKNAEVSCRPAGNLDSNL